MKILWYSDFKVIKCMNDNNASIQSLFLSLQWIELNFSFHKSTDVFCSAAKDTFWSSLFSSVICLRKTKLSDSSVICLVRIFLFGQQCLGQINAFSVRVKTCGPHKNGSRELLASYQGGKPAVGPQRKSGQLGQDGAKSGRAAEAGHHQSHSCSGIQSPKVLALRNHAAGATAQGRMWGKSFVIMMHLKSLLVYQGNCKWKL